MIEVMTETVTLRDVIEDDLPILFLHQSDPESARMAAFPSRDQEAFAAHWAKLLADPSLLKMTILCGDTVVGHVGSFDRSGERQVGYWIGREHWGRGIATRALEIFLARETIRPLYAHVAKHNVGSLRVVEKCGFVPLREEIDSFQGETIEEVVLVLGAS